MIDQIKQALEKAIPTPWETCLSDVVTVKTDIEGYKTQICRVVPCEVAPHNLNLIANAPEWLRYLIGEVERLSKCQSCGGRGYVELSHDPYMTSHCECVIFEQVIEDYPRLKLRNQELQKALEWASRIIGSGLDQSSQLKYDPIAWIQQYHAELKGDETK